MQNSLFTLKSVTGSDGVTGSDVVFGKTQGKFPHGRFTEKCVTTCHSVTNRAEAIVLKANLERRGVLLRAENGAVVCAGASAVLDRFAHEIVRLKPALLELLRRDDPTGPASAAAPGPAPDESPDVAAAMPDVAAAMPDVAAAMPDARALAVAVAGATVGAFIKPTPELLALWRELSAFVGVSLTSRHIGAAARLVAQHPALDNNELLELLGAGLMPDEGASKPVWIEPEQLADETHAAAKARAQQNKLK